MRILLVSKFLHHVGGVETYLAWQARALAAAGHEVGLVGMPPAPGQEPLLTEFRSIWLTPPRDYAAGAHGRARSAAASVYSVAAGRVMRTALQEFRPDVVHFHGTCYQLTPSVVRAAARAGTATVLTAHEYKLLCANQTLFDDHRRVTCTDCLDARGLAAVAAPVRRRCMKSSTAVSALGGLESRVAASAWRAVHPLVLTPSRFMRELLVGHGWSPAQVRHLDLPWQPAAAAPAAQCPRHTVLFLGRLVPEKGAHLLLDAWRSVALRHPDIELRFAGDGPQRAELEATVARDRLPRVVFLGRLDARGVAAQLAEALVTAHPALWLENSPFAVRESLLAAVPALVSDRGGLPELVGPGSGEVVTDDAPSSWAHALHRALIERHAGSRALVADVAPRITTPEQHLHALTSHYRRIAAAGAATPHRRALAPVGNPG